MDDPAETTKSNTGQISPLIKVSAATVDTPVADNSAKIQTLNQHAVTRAESWRSGRMVLGEKYMDDNTKLLIEMIDYCKEHEFQPVLLTIPVFHSLTEAFTKEELEKYYFSNIKEVVNATGVTYIDYSHDERFINNSSYYNNSDHMSADGGDSFMRIYKEDLKAKGFVFS